MTRKRPRIAGPVLRRDAAMAYTGLGDTQFNDWVASGELPAPIRITDSGRSVAWIKQELDDWLAARIAKRDEELATKKVRA